MQSCVYLLGKQQSLGKDLSSVSGYIPGHCRVPALNLDFSSRGRRCKVSLNYRRSCCIKCAATAWNAAALAMGEANKSWALHRWPEALLPCPLPAMQQQKFNLAYWYRGFSIISYPLINEPSVFNGLSFLQSIDFMAYFVLPSGLFPVLKGIWTIFFM